MMQLKKRLTYSGRHMCWKKRTNLEKSGANLL